MTEIFEPTLAPDLPATPEDAIPPLVERRSRFLTRLLRQRGTLVWAGVFATIVVAAILAPVISPYKPDEGDLFATLSGPSAKHLLGTDQLGRDALTRVLYGTRVALLAATEATVIAVVLGLPIGLLIGYRGGRLDRIVMRVVEAIISMPFLVVAIALISVVGPGLAKSMFVVGIIFSTFILRLTRGEVMSEREQLYVDAARVSGDSDRSILGRQVLPNVMPPLIVQVTLLFANGIIIEATLSFLGLGVQPPTASLGSMLADAQTVIRQSFFTAIPAGAMIFLTVLTLNQLGDGLRDVFGRAAKGGSLGVRPVELVTAAAANDGTLIDTSGGAGVTPMLSVHDLSVSFPSPENDRCDVVSHLSFDVQPGEVLGLVGESGSGKSVSAMSCLGLVPDPGRVRAQSITFDGRELVGLGFNEMRSIRGAEIGVVFQEPLACLNPAYTVGEQVAEVLRTHLDMSRSKANERVIELFEMVGIPQAAERVRSYPHEFSGGMAQRVMIAMALACEPKMIIADEPTTALDVTVQGQVVDLLLGLRKRLGTTILLITHDLGVVAEATDRIAVMYAGQLVEVGSTREVFAMPAHPYTAGLLRAIPRNRPHDGPLESIEGSVPSPWHWPTGCHFADRCPMAADVCRDAPVALVTLRQRSNGQSSPSQRSSRCVRAEELMVAEMTTTKLVIGTQG